MRTWVKAILLTVILGGFALSATADQKRQYETVFDVMKIPSYAPWFDGVIFHKNLFLKHYRQKNISDQHIYEMYHYLERIGPHVIFSNTPFLTASERKALMLKQQWTQALIAVSSDQEWKMWKKHFHATLDQHTQDMTRRERQIFLVYVGMDVASPTSFATPHTDLQSYMTQSIGSKRAKAELPTTHDTGMYSLSKLQLETWPFHTGHQIKTTYKESLEGLRHNLRQAGMMGVRLPLGAVKNAQDIDDFSRKVSFYAQSMEERTGWKGAMGVKGRALWFVDQTSTVNAYTLPLAHDVYLIYGPWSSYAHEWFHVVTKSFQEQHPNTNIYRQRQNPYTILRQDIQYKGLTASQWKMLMMEAQQNSYAFFQPKWNALSFPQQWDKPEELMLFSKEKISSSYNAAIASTYVYWLKKPGSNTKVSSFVARRMLADRMLQEVKWSEPGLVEAGYFVMPDEWLASSFQGDMSYRMDGFRRSEISFIQMPLQTEILAYAPHWNRFFENMTPWWEQMPTNI